MPEITIEPDVCESCQQGKQAKLPFPHNQSSRASQKLQLIHTDVCGPMKVASFSGNKCFLLFIDDFTKMC